MTQALLSKDLETEGTTNKCGRKRTPNGDRGVVSDFPTCFVVSIAIIYGNADNQLSYFIDFLFGLLYIMDEGNSIIRLKSKDEKVFEITENEGSISELIRDATEGNDEEAPEIEIGRVNSTCLEKVVDFMKHYAVEKMKEIPTPLGGSTFNEVRLLWLHSGLNNA